MANKTRGTAQRKSLFRVAASLFTTIALAWMLLAAAAPAAAQTPPSYSYSQPHTNTNYNNNNNNNNYNNAPPPPNSGGRRVLLGDVQTLTLHNGKMTSGRRSAPVQQSTCIGGTAAGQYTPPVIQCTNKGWDGVDAQWECKADLDNAYRFGETTVVCEGYDYPDDPYILAGSCGVEYTLELTQEGRDIKSAYTSSAFSANANGGYATHSGAYGNSNPHYGYSDAGGIGFVGILVCSVLLLSCLSGAAGGNRAHHSVHYAGAPPAYTHSAPCGGGGYGSSGYGYSSGGGGGFWTGLATGSMLGSSWSRPYYGYSRGWGSGSGWGSGWGGRNSSSSSSQWGRSSSARSTSSSSSGTRVASGYGGTRRR